MTNLPASKKPAIFLKNNATKGDILAVAALYSHLNSGDRPTVVVASPDNAGMENLKSIVPDINIISDLPDKKFLLSLPKGSSDVKSVQWQQEVDRINVFITMEQGNLSANNLKFEVLGADYDLNILPRVTELSELGDLTVQYPEYFKTTKLFSVGAELNLDETYHFDSSNRPGLTTLAEQIFALIESQQPSTQVCQLLLAGIWEETSQMTRDVASGETFTLMRKLIEKGAKLSENADIINRLNS